MIHGDHHVACARLRMNQHLANRQDRTTRDPGRFEFFEPMSDRLLTEARIEQVDQFVEIAHAIAAGAETRIVTEFRTAENAAQQRIHLVIRRADVDVTVARLERLVGTVERMARAERPWRLTRRETDRRLPVRQRDARLE